ncbi:MetQ/NlpA family ABC transporter substrate-binding protein [Paenibacillus sabinae]|uniref:D-methionine ABC transporter substrate-binding protein n=1 Tax=Paenibacillus sabinae T27 TaxID=1268072 RepID=X4ZV59_9BACL|nr:MetQ/NlpA family ABC transporter substrate-binding protein [Paenibacillus sabinae]AHV96193.1 d-methionine ABC transporter substrate-binding protein [Paenibacillus sabinae T27]
MKKRKIQWMSPLFVIMAVALLISGCGQSTGASSSGNGSKEESKTLRISFNPGPYSDQFKNGVAPYLEKKGYKITYKEFTDGIQPNVAVANGEIDANVFQHSLYLESINKRENINLIGAVQVPTPPMGLYSKKHKSLDEISDGAQVNLPNEPVNMLRALTILKEVGWITLKDNIDPLQTSLNDVTSNPHNIEFVATEPAQGPQALQDVDFAAIQGNFAIANNIKLTTALKLENMTDPFTNIVAVDSKNKDKPFVKDIIEGYHSQEFKDYIKSNSAYEGYRLPAYFNE